MATTYNFTIDAGATFSVEFAIKNDDGSIFDLTGYTATMQIKDMPTSPTFVLETTPTLTVLTGIVGVALTATQTSTLTNSSYVYGIELYGSGGFVLRPVDGKITMSPEIVK